jgi:hypothetical protein
MEALKPRFQCETKTRGNQCKFHPIVPLSVYFDQTRFESSLDRATLSRQVFHYTCLHKVEKI